MQKTILTIFIRLGLFFIGPAMAAICPHPELSGLNEGRVPAPWVLNPFSAKKPEAYLKSQFIRANILVAGVGLGVVCTYRNIEGFYSIWWQEAVKIPAPSDNYWHRSLGGYECTSELEACVFYI